MNDLILPIFSVVFSIIGYFLKQVHTDLEIKHLAEQVTELTTQVRRLIELNTRQTN